jgi:3-oxoacyl-[acyl-carrier-protein] synthase-1
MSALYLHGRSLISALGSDLREAIAGVAGGGVKPTRIALPGGTAWPFFRIDQPQSSWRQRARALLCAAIEQADVGARREAPLFIGSSSFQIGAVEANEAALLDEDYYGFAEAISAWLDWRGPVYLVSTACTSSLNALLAAADHIRAGASEEAVVLGV